MRAMILAAGRGERMGHLTNELPKALLRVAGHYLIEYAIGSLVKAGITEIIINICYQKETIKKALGSGERYGIRILYSEEEERLETGGGIVKALSLLGDRPFLVMSSDIITDYPIATLIREPEGLAHLVMVSNPSFHPHGDFGLRQHYIDHQARPKLTFANIGMYRPELFKHLTPSHFPLNQLLLPAIENQQITGEHFEGTWYNIGTPKELALAHGFFRTSRSFINHCF